MIWKSVYDHIPGTALPIYEMAESEFKHTQVFTVVGDSIRWSQVVPYGPPVYGASRLHLEWTSHNDVARILGILDEVTLKGPTGFLFIACQKALKDGANVYRVAGFVNSNPNCWLSWEDEGMALVPDWLKRPEPPILRKSVWEWLVE